MTLTHQTTFRFALTLGFLCTASSAWTQTTYDFSNATVAHGPAGTLATNVKETSTEGTNGLYLPIAKAQQGPGCQFSGCADPVYGSVTSRTDGALEFAMLDAPLGDVPGYTYGPGGVYVPINRNAYVYSFGNNHGSFYTSLSDPELTYFTFTFTGESVATDHGAQATLTLRQTGYNGEVLFSETAITNDAGAWQMVINTPVGLDLMGINTQFNVSAASGTNTLSSLVITPYLVPEPATWALMGLGLAALGLASRQQRRL